MSLSDTVDTMDVDRVQAKELHKQYRAHRAAQTPEDKAIETAYREIARGRVVIRALNSIREAGWGDDGLPRLALAPADALRCTCRPSSDEVSFSVDNRGYSRGKITVKNMPQRTNKEKWSGVAIVPLVPVYLRPKAHLRQYWTLWEAEWTRVPHDPLLLRRLTGDMWIVLAAWDLTDVEKAALEQRVHT
jgi:hypothetical protein